MSNASSLLVGGSSKITDGYSLFGDWLKKSVQTILLPGELNTKTAVA
jgi:hypothetical protein